MIRRLVKFSVRALPAGTGRFVTAVAASLRSRRIIRIRTFHGVWVYRTGDQVVVSHAFDSIPFATRDDNYALFTRAFAPQSGDVVMDVGSGVGNELLQFATSVGPSGIVVGVEADSYAIFASRILMEASGCTSVVLRQEAIHSSLKTIRLSQDSPAGISNSTIRDDGEGIEVSAVRLDELLTSLGIERVSLMKINIEGAELDALHSLGSRIHDVDNFCISCHDFLELEETRTFSRVTSYLEDYGFRVERHPEVADEPWKSWYVYASR